jgi:hypothetical protein
MEDPFDRAAWPRDQSQRKAPSGCIIESTRITVNETVTYPTWTDSVVPTAPDASVARNWLA